MKKNRLAQQKTSPFELRRETLRQLETSNLQGVAGGGFRIRTPVGYADDTTPIYDDLG